MTCDATDREEGETSCREIQNISAVDAAGESGILILTLTGRVLHRTRNVANVSVVLAAILAGCKVFLNGERCLGAGFVILIERKQIADYRAGIHLSKASLINCFARWKITFAELTEIPSFLAISS